MKIALIGMMLSGKSTIGSMLAQRMQGYRFMETDAMIEQIAGLTIPDIFEKKGEQVFRDLETRIFRQIASQNHVIVSCGGGLPMGEENRRLLTSFDYVFFLDCSISVLLSRLNDEECLRRPLLHGEAESTLRWLMEVRTPIYRESCSHIIEGDRSPSEILPAIVHIITRRHE